MKVFSRIYLVAPDARLRLRTFIGLKIWESDIAKVDEWLRIII